MLDEGERGFLNLFYCLVFAFWASDVITHDWFITEGEVQEALCS